jgi:hypothetical protein
MANPYFYWYPGGTGPLKQTDLGRLPSELKELSLREVADAYSGIWSLSRLDLGGRFRVVVELRRISLLNSTGQSLEANLKNLVDHLQRGFYCGFSLDHAKTWGAWQSPGPSQGGTVVYNASNGFSAWSSSGVLAANDGIVIESGNPDSYREIGLVSSVSGQINLNSGVLYSHQSGYGCLARYRWFFPCLYLPADQVNAAIFDDSSRIHFTCRLELEYDPGIISAILRTQSPQSLGIQAPGIGPAKPAFRDHTAPTQVGVELSMQSGFSLDELMVGARIKSSQSPFNTSLVANTNLTRFL